MASVAPEPFKRKSFYDWRPGIGQPFRDYKLDVLDVVGARVTNVSDEIKIEVITSKHDTPGADTPGADFRWL